MAFQTIYRHFHKAWKDTPYETLSDAQLAGIVIKSRQVPPSGLYWSLGGESTGVSRLQR
jgi:hypothetical protein